MSNELPPGYAQPSEGYVKGKPGSEAREHDERLDGDSNPIKDRSEIRQDVPGWGANKEE